MIANDRELQATLDRIALCQRQVTPLRTAETNPVSYRAAASSFLAEIDRMHLEVGEYLGFIPAKVRSPRLAQPDQAVDFQMALESTPDAGA